VPNFVNIDAAVYTNEQLDEYIRKDCSENLWVPTDLPQALLTRLKLC
jgi:hypothetical protein